MNWLLWIFGANVGIMWLEYVYRSGAYTSFLHALPYIAFPILVGQIGLFYGFRGAPNLLVAGAVFTVMNVILRIANTYFLGETINTYNWLGIVLLVTATFLLKVK